MKPSVWIAILIVWLILLMVYGLVKTSDVAWICWEGVDEQGRGIGGCRPYYGDVLRESSLLVALWAIGLITGVTGLITSLKRGDER